MKKRNIIIIAVAAVIALGAGGFAMMHGKDDKTLEVEVTPVKRAKIVQKVNGTGKIQPNTEVKISSRASSANNQVAQVEGQLRQAQEDLNKTQIFSPISGTVADLKKEAGEIAIGSQFQEDVIMVIAQLGSMEAVVNVDENDINSIKLGQKAEIEVDAVLGETITGQVSEIASSANVPASGQTAQKTEFEVKIAITSDSSKLRPGMTASADIVTATEDKAVSVPIQSVTVRTPDQLGKDGKNYKPGKDVFVELVFVVKDGKAYAKQVTTGIQSNDLIELKSGATEGDQVVSGSYRAISRDLGNDMAVKIGKPGDGNKGGGDQGQGR